MSHSDKTSHCDWEEKDTSELKTQSCSSKCRSRETNVTDTLRSGHSIVIDGDGRSLEHPNSPISSPLPSINTQKEEEILIKCTNKSEISCTSPHEESSLGNITKSHLSTNKCDTKELQNQTPNLPSTSNSIKVDLPSRGESPHNKSSCDKNMHNEEFYLKLEVESIEKCTDDTNQRDGSLDVLPHKTDEASRRKKLTCSADKQKDGT